MCIVSFRQKCYKYIGNLCAYLICGLCPGNAKKRKIVSMCEAFSDCCKSNIDPYKGEITVKGKIAFKNRKNQK